MDIEKEEKEIENLKENSKNCNLKKKTKKNNDLFKPLEVFSIVIITLIVSLSFGFFLGKKTYNKPLTGDLQNFISDYNEIKSTYYKDINEKKVLNEALKSIVNSLGDPYSTAVDDSLSSTLNTELKGEYSGFGIQIANTNDNKIIVLGTIEDSPAEKAGLKSGDIILKMDGKSIDGLTTNEFSNLVKMSKKQKIKLVILRDNQEIEIEVTREIVTLKSVSSEMFERNNKKVAYIYISLFAQNTDKQFITELAKLENEGFDSLIIDVRDNTGGHLTSVENIMNSLVDKSHVIYQIQSKNKTTKHYSTGKTTKKYPIAVLVNGNSASASELLTAMLKDELKSSIIGEKTFGKGTVQEVGYTNSTNLEYKLTTKKWLTPKGEWINEKGITPTIKVELSIEYENNPSHDTDNQLQTAIEVLTK